MTFCTAVNCMDGRVQLPVIHYLLKRFSVKHVDLITEPGPNLILAEQTSQNMVNSIIHRIDISIQKHKSKGIAIVGHHDCAGNPADEAKQIIHIKKAVKFLKKQYRNIEIIGLWVDEELGVNEILKIQ